MDPMVLSGVFYLLKKEGTDNMKRDIKKFIAYYDNKLSKDKSAMNKIYCSDYQQIIDSFNEQTNIGARLGAYEIELITEALKAGIAIGYHAKTLDQQRKNKKKALAHQTKEKASTYKSYSEGTKAPHNG